MLSAFSWRSGSVARMDHSRARILYVTDLAYPARGRRYCDEDIALSARLREEFDVALCHPLDAAALMDGFDAVVVRNSGPVLLYQAAYDAFRERPSRAGCGSTTRCPGRPTWRARGICST